MAITKKPLIRFKILDKCFRNPFKKYHFETLLKEVNKELYDVTGNKIGIKTRQLRDDIAFMRSSEGWNIQLAELTDGKKKIYRYEDLNFSINKAPLNSIELDQFQSAIQMLSQFEGMPQFQGIQSIIAKLKTDLKISINEMPFIGFDKSYDLKGVEHFSFLYNAVQSKLPLQITYKDFKIEDPYTFIFHPYYLKEYNNRWFLFGLNSETGKHDWNVAIDRIQEVKIANINFNENKLIDWQDYFSDMIGVSKPEDAPIEKIVLHFNKTTGKYMESKSIHETQKHRWLQNEILEVEIKVIVNYELERLILSYGESVIIIEPDHLKNKILSRIKNSIINY